MVDGSSILWLRHLLQMGRVDIGCILHWLAVLWVSLWWQVTEEEVHLC